MKLLAQVLLVTTTIQFGTCIRCYDCTSVNNTMCLDPSSYDPETLRRFLVFEECGQGVIPPHRYFCRKIVQTIYHTNRDSEYRVTRGCGWVRSHLDCYKADNHDHLETVCQCFEDGCNRASSQVARWLLVASAAAVFNKRLC